MLRGDIDPRRFVRMSPQELANKVGGLRERGHAGWEEAGWVIAIWRTGQHKGWQRGWLANGLVGRHGKPGAGAATAAAISWRANPPFLPLRAQELAEYRRRKEEEALKMSVLDAEAAARFSTAAGRGAGQGGPGRGGLQGVRASRCGGGCYGPVAQWLQGGRRLAATGWVVAGV